MLNNGLVTLCIATLAFTMGMGEEGKLPLPDGVPDPPKTRHHTYVHCKNWGVKLDTSRC